MENTEETIVLNTAIGKRYRPTDAGTFTVYYDFS
jgi:hypothetical protein